MYSRRFVIITKAEKIEYLHECDRLPYREAPQCFTTIQSPAQANNILGRMLLTWWKQCKDPRNITNHQAWHTSPSLPSQLQMLNLQCFHGTRLPSWLRSANLKKLYIKVGWLSDLGHVQDRRDGEGWWTVAVLHLKCLSELKIDWKELGRLFPKLICLHKVECPELTNKV